MRLIFLQKLSNAGMFRVAKIAVICIAFLLLVRHGFGSESRALTMVGLAVVFGMALAYDLVVRGVAEVRIAAALLGLWAVIAALYFGLRHFDPPKKPWRGPLLAANEKTPPNGCDGRAGAFSGDYLVMIFGTDGVVGQGSGPFTPVRVGSCPLLSFTRNKEGLRMNGFGYDGDDNVVYEIRNNVFRQIIGGYLSAVRPEKNRLELVDDEGRMMLQVSFFNSHAVQITGTFRCGDTDPVVVGKDSVQIGKENSPGYSCQEIGAGESYGIEYTNNKG